MIVGLNIWPKMYLREVVSTAETMHGEDNVLGRFACRESTILAVGRPDNAENNDEEGNHQRRHEQRNDLRIFVSSALHTRQQTGLTSSAQKIDRKSTL